METRKHKEDSRKAPSKQSTERSISDAAVKKPAQNMNPNSARKAEKMSSERTSRK